MRIKIEVTANDIKKGKGRVRSASDCPIARALKRTFPKHKPGCGYDIFFLDRVVHLPKSVTRFQDRLFENKDVKPFSFTLTIPKNSVNV